MTAATIPVPGGRGGEEYETHVTVRCEGDEVARLQRWAETAGLKLTRIVLARGRMISQPMLTLRAEGGLAAQHAAAEVLMARLRVAGFEPVRVKIETTPWSPQAPQDDASVRGQAPDRYFEHHVKLLLDAGFDRQALTAVAVAHGAHLSWNARRIRLEGRQERFVTQRCHGVGARTAGRHLELLLTDLRSSGWEIPAVEREFVLYDNAPDVDAGWIEKGDER
ncbi:hypothetical protein NGB36_18225 [Streptomyces sp. RB6PN25]|uniref:Ankyrin n=2 Tax=Streptomyces humicola TaxID=2953240 RepID=A0ABT1PXS4_9ACTN|nr:hypothetical protein [Streptomyces humicola]